MDASNTFNYIVGVVALTSTLFSALFFFRFYFPGTQMKVLDDLLVETKALYLTAEAEGLLKAEVSIFIQGLLTQYEMMSDSLREVAYRTISLTDKLLAMFRGQTRKIMQLARDVAQLRGIVMTASQKERARRAHEATQTSEPNLGPNINDTQLPLDDASVALTSQLGHDQPSPPSNSLATTTAIGSRTSNGVPLSSLLLLLDERPRTQVCCLCSLVMWWKGQPIQGRSLPSFASPSSPQSPRPPLPDSGPISRSSTLVDDPPPELSLTNRAWTFFALWQSPRAGGKTDDSDGSSNVGARRWNPFRWRSAAMTSSSLDWRTETIPV